MKIDEAIVEAMKKSTLVGSLAWIALWDTERVVGFIKENPGKPYETCFEHCFNLIFDEWRQREKKVKPYWPSGLNRSVKG